MATPKLAKIVLTDLNVSFYLPVGQQTEFHIKFANVPMNIKNGLFKIVLANKSRGEYFVINLIQQYLILQPNKALNEINYILRNSLVIEPG